MNKPTLGVFMAGIVMTLLLQTNFSLAFGQNGAPDGLMIGIEPLPTILPRQGLFRMTGEIPGSGHERTYRFLLGLPFNRIVDRLITNNRFQQRYLELGFAARQYARDRPTFAEVQLRVLPQSYERVSDQVHSIFEEEEYTFNYSEAKIQDVAGSLSLLGGVRLWPVQKVYVDIFLGPSVSLRSIRHKVNLDEIEVGIDGLINDLLPSFAQNLMADKAAKTEGTRLRAGVQFGLNLGIKTQ
ncbi:MAG: hypothetical protein AAF587_33825 [Bacteroidota bacterium]